MKSVATEWTLDGFVDHFDFVHHKMLDHKFVWVLGAGASHASGIPLGSQLVDEWLKEMHLREDVENQTLQEWATPEKLGIKEFTFDKRASFYPKIYQRRFRDYPDEGYAYLESVMSGKDPSPGYSILAAALAADPARHNVVITTNFDNLVADALSIYTDMFPFVAGHESLTGFVRVSMRRPLICKIHRDLLLGPQNDPRSLRRLHDAWGTALRALFQHYTPLFLGYGGNDDTLMDLLESLQVDDIKGQLLWCYYEKDKPSERIVNLVSDLSGVLVPVPDFDLLMVLLGERMEISLLDQEIGRRSAARTERYRDRIKRLDTVNHPSVTQALAATFERSGGWWAWYQKADAEQDLGRREVVYKQGLSHYPNSPELHSAFATFVWKTQGRVDEADQLYRKALELDPENASTLTGHATFLWRARGKFEEANRLFRKALELHPENYFILGSFANLMRHTEGGQDEAVRMYKKSIELNPKNAVSTGNLANLVWQGYQNVKEADRLYRKALEIDPNDGLVVANYAAFLLTQGRLHEAGVKLQHASTLHNGQNDQLSAELALSAIILSYLTKRNPIDELLALRTLLGEGFQRSPWSFDSVLEFARKEVSVDEYAILEACASAILDSTKVNNLIVVLDKKSAATS